MKKAAESPRIVIIAGPNGAGKTTFAQEYLPKEAGFPDFINVKLIFLSLPSADLAIARVKNRAAQGGHSVPADTVRRRFDTGLRNFRLIYCKIVDTWELYDNSGASPRLIDKGSNA
ncbi:MAG: hypothetical protein M1376_13555 [Planctomycetes bacterium]|nr:hypothetical protein [Planctomycetota bacterium]